MNYLNDYIVKHKSKISQVNSNAKQTEKAVNKITSTLNDLYLHHPDYDIVLFGSIARYEYSSQSDIDWTLLIDGQSKAEHFKIHKDIQQELSKAKFIDPGDSGLFGQITFSQSLIHNIGGESDTNHNLTRRILLLLESMPIVIGRGYKCDTYNRVLKNLISVYVDLDSGFSSHKGKTNKVPRFLLNDIVRLWRTMCVDFAYKQKNYNHPKWGLRNIKLRMSRKLSYIKGLLLVYSCYKNTEIDIKHKETLIDHLFENSQLTPIEILVKLANERKLETRTVNALLRKYNDFLVLISTKTNRDKLHGITMDTAYLDKEFLKARQLTMDFQKIVNNLFLKTNPLLEEFILAYGIF